MHLRCCVAAVLGSFRCCDLLSFDSRSAPVRLCAHRLPLGFSGRLLSGFCFGAGLCVFGVGACVFEAPVRLCALRLPLGFSGRLLSSLSLASWGAAPSAAARSSLCLCFELVAAGASRGLLILLVVESSCFMASCHT